MPSWPASSRIPDLTLWRSSEVERAVGPEELREFTTWMAGLPGSFTIEYDGASRACRG